MKISTLLTSRCADTGFTREGTGEGHDYRNMDQSRVAGYWSIIRTWLQSQPRFCSLDKMGVPGIEPG